MGCKTGNAKITKGYKLPAKHVIHTVGPVWPSTAKSSGGQALQRKRDQAAELLASCYRNSLRLVVENGLKSVAFPCISTGVYRYPKQEACEIAIRETKAFLEQNPSIEKVIFVCFSEADLKLYQDALS